MILKCQPIALEALAPQNPRDGLARVTKRKVTAIRKRFG